jgi:FMN phosphatase YigB (HAD superfamily)
MKPILFIDFDGTLCHDRFWRSLEPDLLHKIQGYVFGANTDLVSNWMKGAYTSEDIHKQLATDLSIGYDHVWQVFVRDCESMMIEESVLKDISDLRSKYKVILCTDNMDCFSRFTVPALRLLDYFDEIINSYEMKMSKNDNDGELFLKTIKNHNSSISESTLIDNSKNTCDIFKNLGGKTCFVTEDQPLSAWLKDL